MNVKVNLRYDAQRMNIPGCKQREYTIFTNVYMTRVEPVAITVNL